MEKIKELSLIHFAYDGQLKNIHNIRSRIMNISGVESIEFHTDDKIIYISFEEGTVYIDEFINILSDEGVKIV